MTDKPEDRARRGNIQAARDQQRDEAEADYEAELLAIEEAYKKALLDAGLEEDAGDEE